MLAPLTLLLMVGLLLGGCAASGARTVQATGPADDSAAVSDDAAAAPTREIEALELREGAPGMQLELLANGPLVWTSYRDSAGNLVVELPNALPGPAVQDVTAAEGLVSSILLEEEEIAGRPLTRLTVATRQEASHSLEAEGDRLLLDLLPVEGGAGPADNVQVAETQDSAEEYGSEEYDSGEYEAADSSISYEPLPADAPAAEGEDGLEQVALEEVSVETASAPSSGPSESFDSAAAEEPLSGPAATVLRGVEIASDLDGTAVTVQGDGIFDYSTIQLSEPARFVIDLNGVVNASAQGTVPVGGEVLSRVRLAQFKPFPEPVSRVVFDLKSSQEPRIQRRADGLVVYFGEAAMVAVEEAPMASSGGEEADPWSESATSTTSTEWAEAEVADAGVEAPEETEYADASTEAASEYSETTEVEAAEGEARYAEAESAVEESYEAGAEDTGTEYSETEYSETEYSETQDSEAQDSGIQYAEAEEAEAAPQQEDDWYSEGQTAEAAVEETPQYEEATRYADTQPVAEAREEVRYEPPPALEEPPITSDVAMFEAAEVEYTEPAEEQESLTTAVTPEFMGGGAQQWSGDPISLSLKDADIKDVLRSFSTITGLNVVVHPGVRGSVTVELNEVPWDQALDLILRINNLDYVLEGNIMRIASTSQLEAEAQARRALAAAQAQEIPLETVIRAVSYAEAPEIARLLTTSQGVGRQGQTRGSILSSRGSVTVDNRTNKLIIKELPTNMQTVLAIIQNLDTAEPQVLIEARIVETTKQYSRTLGIQWNFDGVSDEQFGNTTGLVFPNQGTINGGAQLLTGGQNGFLGITMGNILNTFNLDLQLQAAETEGLVSILSAPKISVLNNEQANIQSGLQIPIQTVSNNTVSVQFVNATLSLNVTPQVTAEGTVLLDIDIAKRAPQPALAVAGSTNAPISTKQARTRVIVRDGGTTVIGGIYEVTADRGEDRVPGLANVPILGHLFKNKRRNNNNEELLIFVTPRVIQL